MKTYYLHANAAKSQFERISPALLELEDVIRRITALLPLIELGRAELFYDERLDERASICDNEPIVKLANSLPKNSKTLWFLYTKNRARKIKSPFNKADLTDLPNREVTLSDTVAPGMATQGMHWLSFSGIPTFSSANIEIRLDAGNIIVENSHSLAAMCANWPLYQASPKHGLEDYQRKGVVVSSMDLDEPEAQGALLISTEHGRSRYTRLKGRWYRFLPSGGSENLYHGFRVSIEQVPPEVREVQFI